MTLRSLAMSLACLGLVACSKKTQEADPPDVGAPAPSASAAAAAPSAAPSAPEPPDPFATSKPDDTLFGVIAEEGQHRPTIKPNADDVFAALSKAGIKISNLKPSLGRTYKAAYCTGGPTDDMGIAVIVCEYPDDKAAGAGLEAAKKTFPTMTNRTEYTHKSTMLIAVNRKGDAAGDERVKKVVAVYNTL